MSNPRVYLAGPISGLSHDQSEDWRDRFRAMVPEIDCFSPLRGKSFLKDLGIIEDSYAGLSPLAGDRAIMTRDHNDCKTADMIVCNFLGATRISIGTCMEIAFSYAYKVPLLMIMEPSGNPHDYLMIREAIGFRVTKLEDAAAVAMSILFPGKK